VRQAGGQPFVTDNGNFILDCGTSAIERAAELETRIVSIPGVVGTGLFLGMADMVLVQRGPQVETHEFRRDAVHEAPR
jgi:ribose 5-phosphate isomerase A